MSKVITQSLEGGILHSFGLVNEFIKQCPDNIWGQQYGRWPVWQQLYHSFTVIDFFLRADGAAESAGFLPPAIGNLEVIGEKAPSKQAMQEYIEKAQEQVKTYVARLDDAALATKNAGLSARMGRDTTHAATLNLISAHTMYHLGSCDAALRQNGLPGVF